jgi:outer membrane immunogenic protein
MIRIGLICFLGRAVPGYSIDWTGPYIGANAGLVSVRSSETSRVNCGSFIPDYFNCGNQGVVDANGTGSTTSSRAASGLEGGYAWQFGKWVIGLDTGYGGFRAKASRTSTSAYLAVAPGVPFVTQTSLDADGSLTSRARIGLLPIPTVQIFGAGGVVSSNITMANRFRDYNSKAFGSGAGSSATNKMGWTAGAGAEWNVSPHWSTRVEYAYASFGHIIVTSVVNTPLYPDANSFLATETRLTAGVWRLGVDYRF